MATVVLLKGVNVGGHRNFRPSVLAKELSRLDVVNVGAAGSFVVRQPVGRRDLRAEILRRLPFQAEVMICSGSDVVRLVSCDPFAGHAAEPGIVQFVSVLARRRTLPSAPPLELPADGDWCLKVLGCRDRFVYGLHRREMRAIGCLGRLENILGVPLTTRTWNTMVAIARILGP